MRKWMRCLQVFGLTLFLAACGDTGKNTKPVPTPVPLDPGASVPLPAPTPVIDPRLPDLKRAAPVALTDRANLSALKDLAHNVFPPLVGDPLLQLSLTRSREQNISGKLLFSFEDQFGFWGAELQSFASTGFQTDTKLDIIFADDEFVLRVAADRTIDDLTGLLFYRIRQTADTACRSSFVTCEVSGFPYFNFPPQCFSPTDASAQCRSYMNLSGSSVKSIGAFRAKFSSWAILNDGIAP